MLAGVGWIVLILTSSASAFSVASQSAFAVRGGLLDAASYGRGGRAAARSNGRLSRVERQAMQMSWWDDLFAMKKPGKTEKREVVVVGAGVSGLICAKKLQAEGKDVVVVEQSDGVGGRVRTDRYKGFLLDRGFQVFIEAYPKVKENLDYTDLQLQSFWPGALVRADGGFHTVADPFRRPQDSIKGLLAPVGSLSDKVRVALLRIQATQTSLDSVFQAKETDTESFLVREKGFGPMMVDRFFRPFYQGIFLAPLSEQSSRMFGFVFKMFAMGGISLPKGGIGALSDQLASKLKPGSIRLNSAVKSVSPGRVTLRNGDILNAAAIVVATDEPSTRSILGSRMGPSDLKTPVKGRGSTCLYYATPGKPPIGDPLLILNGEGTSDKAPVNNVVFLNSINSDYAPPGQSLVSVTVVGIPALNDAQLDACVRKQLTTWFGEKEVTSWEFLRTYRVPYAQPAQTPPNGASFTKPSALGEGLFVCGDFRNTATLNGAFESGELAAKEVLTFLSSPQQKPKIVPPAVKPKANKPAVAAASQ